MKKLAILFALTLCAALAGCSQPAQGEESPAPQESSKAEVITASPADESDEPRPPEGERTVTLYIGTKAGGFAEYAMTYEGELTPEALI